MIVRRQRGVAGPVRQGVSLIEVLLATAIFLISIAAISVLTSVASNNAAEATRTNLCSRLARMKMAELEAGVGDVTVGNAGSGTFPEYPNYQWEMTATPVSNLPPGTFDVTVRVWIETGTTRPTEVSLSQIILDPYLMNNAAPLSPPTPPTTETAP